MTYSQTRFNRRRFLAGFAGVFKMTEGDAGAQLSAQGVNRNSAPSQLRITDMRSVLVASN